MHAQLAAVLLAHHGLDHGTEDVRVDGRPIEIACRQDGGAALAGDVWNGEVVTEEGLPDEREGGEMLGQGFPLVLGGAHDAEEAAEVV